MPRRRRPPAPDPPRVVERLGRGRASPASRSAPDPSRRGSSAPRLPNVARGARPRPARARPGRAAGVRAGRGTALPRVHARASRRLLRRTRPPARAGARRRLPGPDVGEQPRRRRPVRGQRRRVPARAVPRSRPARRGRPGGSRVRGREGPARAPPRSVVLPDARPGGRARAPDAGGARRPRRRRARTHRGAPRRLDLDLRHARRAGSRSPSRSRSRLPSFLTCHSPVAEPAPAYRTIAIERRPDLDRDAP